MGCSYSQEWGGSSSCSIIQIFCSVESARIWTQTDGKRVTERVLSSGVSDSRAGEYIRIPEEEGVRLRIERGGKGRTWLGTS